jgi:hypothetical protein
MRFNSDDLQLKMNGKPILELEIMHHENDWSKSTKDSADLILDYW